MHCWYTSFNLPLKYITPISLSDMQIFQLVVLFLIFIISLSFFFHKFLILANFQVHTVAKCTVYAGYIQTKNFQTIIINFGKFYFQRQYIVNHSTMTVIYHYHEHN